MARNMYTIHSVTHTRKIKRKKVRAFNTPATQAAQKPKTAVVLVKQGLVQNQHTSRARNILTTQGSVLKTITTHAHCTIMGVKEKRVLHRQQINEMCAVHREQLVHQVRNTENVSSKD